MSIRFWRRIRLAPWLWLNLSKSGVSITFGRNGLTFTVGKSGLRYTLGLPGSGLFYTGFRRKPPIEDVLDIEEQK